MPRDFDFDLERIRDLFFRKFRGQENRNAHEPPFHLRTPEPNQYPDPLMKHDKDPIIKTKPEFKKDKLATNYLYKNDLNIMNDFKINDKNNIIKENKFVNHINALDGLYDIFIEMIITVVLIMVTFLIVTRIGLKDLILTKSTLILVLARVYQNV
jgi:hypothetical protein